MASLHHSLPHLILTEMIRKERFADCFAFDLPVYRLRVVACCILILATKATSVMSNKDTMRGQTFLLSIVINYLVFDNSDDITSNS